jgi:hypothetical protein
MNASQASASNILVHNGYLPNESKCVVDRCHRDQPVLFVGQHATASVYFQYSHHYIDKPKSRKGFNYPTLILDIEDGLNALAVIRRTIEDFFDVVVG